MAFVLALQLERLSLDKTDARSTVLEAVCRLRWPDIDLVRCSFSQHSPTASRESGPYFVVLLTTTLVCVHLQAIRLYIMLLLGANLLA